MSKSEIEVLDRLGHPCSMHAALKRYAEPLDDAAREKDPYLLRRTLARQLMDLSDRIEGAACLAPSFRDMAKDEEGKALWHVMTEYQVRTADALYW